MELKEASQTNTKYFFSECNDPGRERHPHAQGSEKSKKEQKEMSTSHSDLGRHLPGAEILTPHWVACGI